MAVVVFCQGTEVVAEGLAKGRKGIGGHLPTTLNVRNTGVFFKLTYGVACKILYIVILSFPAKYQGVILDRAVRSGVYTLT